MNFRKIGFRGPAGQDQRGMALILVILILSVIFTVVIDYSSRSAMINQASLHWQAETHMEQGALSALALAGQLLLRDQAQNSVDSAQDIWAQEHNFAGLITTEGLVLSMRIEDEQGKFNPNTLSTEYIDEETKKKKRAKERDAANKNNQVTPPNQPENDQNTKRVERKLPGDKNVKKQVIDKFRLDVMTRLVNARTEESKFMKDLVKHVEAAPLHTFFRLTELQQYPELHLTYWGLKGEAYSLPPINDVMSVWPQTRPININTAPPEVIMALFPNDSEAIAEAIVEERSETPFKTPGDLNRIGLLGAQQRQNAMAHLSTTSDTFRVKILAEYDGYKLRRDYILRRGKDGIEILFEDTQQPYF